MCGQRCYALPDACAVVFLIESERDRERDVLNAQLQTITIIS